MPSVSLFLSMWKFRAGLSELSWHWNQSSTGRICLSHRGTRPDELRMYQPSHGRESTSAEHHHGHIGTEISP